MTSAAPEPTDEQRDRLLLATAREVIDRVLREYTAAEDDVARTEQAVVSALVEVGAFPDIAAAVAAEREKYLQVAKACDVESARERQYFTERLDEGNEPAALVCTGMSIGWDHAARRIRGVSR